MNEAERGNNVELNIPHISQLRTRTVSRSFLECLLLHFFDGEIRWIRGLGFVSFLLSWLLLLLIECPYCCCGCCC